MAVKCTKSFAVFSRQLSVYHSSFYYRRTLEHWRDATAFLYHRVINFLCILCSICLSLSRKIKQKLLKNKTKPGSINSLTAVMHLKYCKHACHILYGLQCTDLCILHWLLIDRKFLIGGSNSIQLEYRESW